MGNVFTLDSLREEAARQFAPVQIVVSDGSTVTLRNILRLKKREREVVLAKLKELESIEKDDETPDEIEKMVDVSSEILALVADDDKKLLKELDGDVTVILKVLGVWMESSQPGEAQPSPA